MLCNHSLCLSMQIPLAPTATQKFNWIYCTHELTGSMDTVIHMKVNSSVVGPARVAQFTAWGLPALPWHSPCSFHSLWTGCCLTTWMQAEFLLCFAKALSLLTETLESCYIREGCNYLIFFIPYNSWQRKCLLSCCRNKALLSCCFKTLGTAIKPPTPLQNIKQFPRVSSLPAFLLYGSLLQKIGAE